ISPGAATGAPVTGTVKLSKPDHVLGVALHMDGIGGNAGNLTMQSLKVDAGLKEGDRLLQMNMNPPAQWDVLNKSGGLSAMQGDIRIDDQALPDGSVTLPFVGSLHADLLKDELSSEINAVFNGSQLDFTLAAKQLDEPKLVFDLSADKFDLNALFP